MEKLLISFFVLIFSLVGILNSAALDEIFQDVNVSGDVRYRFEHNNPKNKNNNNAQQRVKIQMH
ncbi:mini-MOMP protein [Campylobacter insulaenigrae]|uniref:Mini-MOMP protein n=1 Tax=Campylobacter insulaenigrae TaxID=260714 RepID=A0ABY3G6X8_9BACT|nr:mini-MOMP protein [Campylobacter insulaenigrae]TWO28083.1 mini-MOMP protein [Campylobacter insulaenigrae]